MAETKFKVLHSGVGAALQGEVVTFPQGVNTDRLLELGAVEVAEGDAAKQEAVREDSLASTMQADQVAADQAAAADAAKK